jgi:uncharacterized protein DUF4838
MFKRYFLVLVSLLFFCQFVSCQEKNAPQAGAKKKSEGIFCSGDGNRLAEFEGIFTYEEPSFLDSLAAEQLKQYLREFFSTDLQVLSLSESSSNNQGRILIGEAALLAGTITKKEVEKAGEGGYCIHCADGCVSIAGLTGDGTLSGVHAFLEQAGAVFLSATVHIPPRQKKYIVPDISLSRSPTFKFRSDFAPYQPGYTHGRVIGDPKELGSKHSWVHTADFLLDYEKYHEQHPEYFALMKDGRRLTPDPNSWRFDVHVCMSNPEVRQEVAGNLCRWIEAQPDRKYFMVSQGDGRGDKWCQCSKCQAMDEVAGEVMTDRLLDFVNFLAREVAKKYPDKVLFTLSYTEATGPVPVRVKPEPNVRVMYCPYPMDWGCQSHALCEQNSKGMKDLANWVGLCPKQVFIFDYPVGYKMPLEIFGSFYAMIDKIRYYAESGIEGVQFCGSPRNFNSLFKYVMNKLMWDAETDVEKAIDEFMGLYYGKDAGPVIREYFDLIYSEVRERPVHQMCEGGNPGLVNEEFARKGYDVFERAMEAAGSHEEYRQRLIDEKLFLLFSDLNNHHKVNGVAQKDMESYAKKLAEFTQIARDKQLKSHERRKSMPEFFWNTARIRFSADPWYNDPAVDEFLKNPIAMLQE